MATTVAHVDAHEGPVYVAEEDALYFTSVPRPQVAIKRLSLRSGRVSLVAPTPTRPTAWHRRRTAACSCSPDERVLYVGDSGEAAHRIEAFDVGDGVLTGRRRFAAIARGYPDGIKADGAGRVYSAGPAGVHVFDPGGDLVAEIDLPGAVNLAFAGPDRIYVTADTAVWAAPVPELVKEA